MSFETERIALFCAKSRCFLRCRVLPQKQCGMLSRHYHFKTARYGLRNDRTFSINIGTDCTSIPISRVLQKDNVAKFLFQ